MAMSDLDFGQIIKRVYDSVEDALKVTGDISVVINAEKVDDSAFTVGSSSVSVIGAFANDSTPDSVNEGDAGAVRMSTNRNLYIQMRDGEGNERSAYVTAANAVKVDGSAVTQPISAASLPLPTGASTAANQSTANASLSSIDGKIVAVNTGAVVVSSSALPTGAATESTLSTLNGKVTEVNTGAVTISTALPAGTNAIGKLAANDGVDIGDVTINNGSGGSAVNIQDGGNSITVDGTVAATQSGTWNITDISGTVSLPTGAATAANQTTANSSLSSIDGKIPSNLTVTSTRLLVDGSGVTQPVSGSLTTTDAGYTNSEFVRNDYSSVNVTTGAYVQLIASTAAAYQEIEIFDSSGRTLKIAFGGSGSEVDKFLVFPGGNGRIKRNVPSGTRISIRAVSASATSGEISLNLYG